MENCEFMNKNDGGVVVVTERDARTLKPEDTELLVRLWQKIRHQYPEAWRNLKNKYREYAGDENYFMYRCVLRFIKCNWGRYDIKSWDIEADHWNFEKVDCPLRGECELEGIVCFPKTAWSLSPKEIEILRLLAEGKTALEIALATEKSVHTINTEVRNLHEKFGTHSSKQLIAYYYVNKDSLEQAVRP